MDDEQWKEDVIASRDKRLRDQRKEIDNLKKDKERLDWLERYGLMNATTNDPGEPDTAGWFCWPETISLRKAIDDAMHWRQR